MNNKLLVNVVDDDLNIRTLLTKILQKEGYNVVQYSSATEAIEKIDTSLPQIIISDIMMPGMNGIEFCSIIKSRHNYIYFILLTAKNSIEDKIIGMDIGADEYITKPFDKFEVISRVNAGKRIVDTYIKTLNCIEKIKNIKDNLNCIKELINTPLNPNNKDIGSSVNDIENFLTEILFDLEKCKGKN